MHARAGASPASRADASSPTPTRIHLDGGFEKGRSVPDHVHRGGRAGARPLAWPRCATACPGSSTATRPRGIRRRGALRWAYAYGRSQTGRLLRTLAYEDLNLDEDGREAIDGIIANVAGGMRGEFNQRFGQNSKDRNHMMAHLFPFTDQPRSDPDTGVKDALHARLDARGSRLRAFYTNTSAEYHRGDASLIHTDPDGGQDAAHGPDVRVYHFAGHRARARHLAAHRHPARRRGCDGHGRALPAPARRGGLRAAPAGLPRAPRPLGGRGRRAAAEPTSPYRRRHRGPAGGAGTGLQTHTRGPLPGSPCEAAAARLDEHAAAAGRARSARSSPHVDADGNEVGGIVLPELAVPLATHTGWNLRHPDVGGAEQLLVFAGATLPFHRTRAEREAAGDPRPSIEERYASRADYLERVRGAAGALARAGYLLEEDVELSVAAGGRLWDQFAAAGAIASPASPATAAGPRAPARGTSWRRCGTGASVAAMRSICAGLGRRRSP